jgi:hypothetical protein
MGQQIRQAGHSLSQHVRRQAIAYLALAVALGGSAYAGTKASSSKVGGKDLRPFVLRDGNLITIQPDQPGTSTAECKRGERAMAPLGAGSLQGGRGAVMNDIASLGVGKRQGFFLTALNDTSQPQTFQARVLCLRK